MEQQFKIATSGWLSEEFHNWVVSKYPDIEINRAADRAALQSIIKDSNAYAGFYELDDCDLSNIKWIHCFGAGVDAFLANKAIQSQQIPISRTTGSLGRKIGEYCLGHILNHYQHIPRYHDAQQKQLWKPKRPRQLREAVLLILGTGSVGQGIAQCFSGLVHKIIGANTNGSGKPPFDESVKFNSDLPSADIIINALPKTLKTDGALDVKFFDTFQQSIFINVGRGQTVVNDDLIGALENKHLSHAILDVFDTEPLPTDSKLWKHPQISVTPHVSGLTTLDDISSSFDMALEQIKSDHLGAFVDYHNGY